MAIPSAPELMRPVLAAHNDGSQLRLEEIADRVAPTVGVSVEARAQRQPSGHFVFAQRIGWARNYLEQRGLIDRPAYGQSRITDAGRQALASGEPIELPPADWATISVTARPVLTHGELPPRRRAAARAS